MNRLCGNLCLPSVGMRARRLLLAGGASFFWLVGSILFCGRALLFQPRTHISGLPAAVAAKQKTLGKGFVRLQKPVKCYAMNLENFTHLRYGKQIFRRGHGGTSNRSHRAVFLLKNSRLLGSCAKLPPQKERTKTKFFYLKR